MRLFKGEQANTDCVSSYLEFISENHGLEGVPSRCWASSAQTPAPSVPMILCNGNAHKVLMVRITFIPDYKLLVDEPDTPLGNLYGILHMKYLEMKWKM